MADLTVAALIDTFMSATTQAAACAAVGAPALAAANTFSASAAASTPAISITGAPFAGTGTTSFPLVYINQAGAAASTTLATTGTMFGVNSLGTCNLMDLLAGGVSRFKVSSAGDVTVFSSVNAVNYILTSAASLIYWPGSTPVLSKLGTANLRLGYVPSASPVAQTFTIGEASRPGTDSNVAGGNATIQSGLGTGTALSSLIFQTPTATSGTTVQPYATGWTVKSGAGVAPSYTVATLPTAANVGMGGIAAVTDATQAVGTALGTAPTGGGAVKRMVYCDGAAWLLL